MMNSAWKEAWWLSKFEWKTGRRLILLSGYVLLYSIFLLGLSNGAEYYFTNQLLFDCFFIFGAFSMPFAFRSKDYQVTRISGDLWGSNYVNFLNKLPIPEAVLVKSRFLTQILQATVINGIIISALLTFSSFYRNSLSVGEAILFFIVWILISGSVACLFAASEVGDVMSMTKIILFSILFYSSLLVIVGVYYFYTQTGIVNGSIFLIKNYPTLTLIGASILMIISYLSWNQYARKKIRSIDYL